MTRVLIIDDNQMLTSLYRAALAAAGFHVEVAHDGASGLQIAQQRPPDVVLLDLMLPNMSGFEVLSTLRTDPVLARTPVIVLSNAYTAERTAEVLNLGATQMLTKVNSSPKVVLDAVRQAVQRT